MSRALALLLLAAALSGCAFDDTDDAARGVRSGLLLYTDHGTGCEYVGAPALTLPPLLTPRLGPDGRPLCRPELRRAQP